MEDFDLSAGERIRQLRKDRGIPLVVLAKMSRVSIVTLSGLERWGVLPRRASRLRIAQALGASEAALFEQVAEAGNGEQPSNSEA